MQVRKLGYIRSDDLFVFRNELPLMDYITTQGNFGSGYIQSTFYPAGYFAMGFNF